MPPLRVRDAVAAFTDTGLPGLPQSFVADVGLDYLVPPDPRAHGEEWGLGEVSLTVSARGWGDELEGDDVVDLLGFRRPDPGSVLRASCAVAAHAPLVVVVVVVVVDESMTCVVVFGGDTPDDVRPSWPW